MFYANQLEDFKKSISDISKTFDSTKEKKRFTFSQAEYRTPLNWYGKFGREFLRLKNKFLRSKRRKFIINKIVEEIMLISEFDCHWSVKRQN